MIINFLKCMYIHFTMSTCDMKSVLSRVATKSGMLSHNFTDKHPWVSQSHLNIDYDCVIIHCAVNVAK